MKRAKKIIDNVYWVYLRRARPRAHRIRTVGGRPHDVRRPEVRPRNGRGVPAAVSPGRGAPHGGGTSAAPDPGIPAGSQPLPRSKTYKPNGLPMVKVR